ncbi:MAG: hypothetical protein KAS13_04255 [Candidatus Omnitrophica bacterium]|nr:hypothetical protein [Candidatus Omnitrophota bacterium]
MLKKIKPKKKEILLIYITVGVLVSLFFDRFFLPGVQSRFKGSHDRMTREELRLKRNLRIQSRKDEILEEYEFCKLYLGNRSANENQIVAELLKEVETIVTAAGGIVVNLNPNDEPRGFEYYRKYSVEFRLEVSFEEMLEFLDKVRKSKFLIKLDRLVVVEMNKQASILRVDGVVSLAVPN